MISPIIRAAAIIDRTHQKSKQAKRKIKQNIVLSLISKISGHVPSIVVIL